MKRLLDHPAVKKTCSELNLYLDSYERCGTSLGSDAIYLSNIRYAVNRPNTSQVANAINEGISLP